MPRGLIRTTNAPGRARGRVYSAAEVADILGVSVARVVHHCEVASRAGAASFFFGAWMDSEGWQVPERALRRALGGIVHQHYTVAEVASLARVSEWLIRDRLCIVPAGVDIEMARQPWQIGARMLFGSDVRIPGPEVERISAGRVAGRPAA